MTETKRVEDGLRAKSIDVEKRTLRATVSSDMVDRDGDVVLPSAFEKRLDTYRKSPVLLWSHNPLETPIGRALSIEVRQHTLEAEFLFRKDTARAEDVFNAYAGGFLTSFSIGFRTHKREPDHDAFGRPISKVVDAELWEISAVAVPANTEAVVKLGSMAETLKAALYPSRFSSPEAPALSSQATWPYSVSDFDTVLKGVSIMEEWIADGTYGDEVERVLAEAFRARLYHLTKDNGSLRERKIQEEIKQCLAVLKGP